MRIRFTDRSVDSVYTSEKGKHRRLVLVGIEYITGGDVSMEARVCAAQAAIEVVVRHRADAQLVLACERFSVDIVDFERVGAHRLRFRNGADGADLELLDVLATEHIGERFREVVLVSGDGIFAGTISRLATTSGTEVTVVTRPAARSHRLRMAAKCVLHVDLDTSAIMEAS